MVCCPPLKIEKKEKRMGEEWGRRKKEGGKKGKEGGEKSQSSFKRPKDILFHFFFHDDLPFDADKTCLWD
jgi:hypothetical protein